MIRKPLEDVLPDDLDQIARETPALPRSYRVLRQLIALLPNPLAAGTQPSFPADDLQQPASADQNLTGNGLTGDGAPASIPGTAIMPGTIPGSGFVSTVKPVLIVNGLPTLPNANYPINTFVYDISGSPASLWKNVANVWTRAIGASDIQADSITAGQIAAGAIATSELAASAVTADKVAANSLDVGHTSVPTGGNLVGNPGFELDGNTSAGDPLTGWLGLAGGITTNVQTTGLPRSGAYACRIIGPTDGVASARFIPVVPGARYKIRLWGRGDGANIGIGRLQARVHWYDATFVQLSSQSTSADLGTGTTFTEIVAQFTAPTTAVYAKVRAQTGSTNDASDKVYVDDMEFFRADEDINHAGGDVVIDSTGIVINNGKLTLQDAFGTSSLGASGFSGSWSDFVRHGLYNSSLQGTTGALPNGRTASLPYWSVSQDIGSPTITALAGGGVKVAFAAASNAASFTSDNVPIRPNTVLEGAALISSNVAGGDVIVDVTVFWYKADGSASATASTSLIDSFDMPASLTQKWVGSTVVAPSDAYQAHIWVRVREGAHNAANWGEVFAVKLVDAPMYVPPGQRYTDGAQSLLSGTAGGTINNWNPGSIDTIDRYQVDPTADMVLTGMVAPAVPGRIVTLFANNSHSITLLDENTGSTAANRFHLGSERDLFVRPGGSVTLVYDNLWSRWMPLSSSDPAWPMVVQSFIGTIASSSATLTLNPVGGALAGNGLVMPWGGRILGIAIRATSARTAGTATATATVNGTNKSLVSAVLNATNTSGAASATPLYISSDTFAAGDSLRARVVTSSFTPTANAVQVDVYLTFDKVG